MGAQAARQAELEKQWRDAEAERQRKLEEQRRAQAELEADRARQAKDLESLREKLERLKAEKQDLVLQLKQVCATPLVARSLWVRRALVWHWISGMMCDAGFMLTTGWPTKEPNTNL